MTFLLYKVDQYWCQVASIPPLEIKYIFNIYCGLWCIQWVIAADILCRHIKTLRHEAELG